MSESARSGLGERGGGKTEGYEDSKSFKLEKKTGGGRKN